MQTAAHPITPFTREILLNEEIDTVLTRADEVARVVAAGAGSIDREGAFPTREFVAMHAAGLHAVPLRADLGGLGLGSEPGRMHPLLRLLAAIGWGNLSVARLYEGHVNALLLIQTFGSVPQIARFAGDARDRGRLFGVWNTGAAEPVRFLPIGGGRFRLLGMKTFASGSGHLDRPLITGALPDGGWQMAVLPEPLDGSTVDASSWRPLGMRATASHCVDLTGIEIGLDHLIGAPGDYYRQPWFSGGAIRFAAAQLGGAAALLDAARDELRVLGRTEDSFQRARMGQAAIAVESGRLWLRGAADLADRSPLGGARADEKGAVGDAEMVAYSNMTRTAIERVCLETLEIVERAVGARGLLQPHPIERIGRDLTLYLRQPAPDAALLDAGRHTLTDLRSVLHQWNAGEMPDET